MHLFVDNLSVLCAVYGSRFFFSKKHPFMYYDVKIRPDNMMGPWETAPPQVEEEEIDIFAELGAMRPVEAQPVAAQHSVPTLNTSDPLAVFMEDDDAPSMLAGESTFSLNEQASETMDLATMQEVAAQPEPSSSTPVSHEVVTELLEILVKKELHSRVERGDDWLSDLPAEAIAKIETAKVIKDQQAYHLSLIIDMVGTGEVRPFATVLSTTEGTLPVAPPPQIPQSWHPLYNALRELLLNAMNSLTAIKVVAN